MSARYTIFDHSRLSQYKARFEAKIIKDSGIGPNGDCWDWNAGKDKDGYANFSINGRKIRAHRMMFFFVHGRWPEPQCLHSCDTECCTNPEHLSEGTLQENTRQAIKRRRYPRGEQNASRRYPEKLKRGDNHPSRLLPHTRPCGRNHWMRKDGFKIVNGKLTKLTEAQAITILRMYRSGDYSAPQIAARFNVSDVSVTNIASGKTWAYLQELIL